MNANYLVCKILLDLAFMIKPYDYDKISFSIPRAFSCIVNHAYKWSILSKPKNLFQTWQSSTQQTLTRTLSTRKQNP